MRVTWCAPGRAVAAAAVSANAPPPFPSFLRVALQTSATLLPFHSFYAETSSRRNPPGKKEDLGVLPDDLRVYGNHIRFLIFASSTGCSFGFDLKFWRFITLPVYFRQLPLAISVCAVVFGDTTSGDPAQKLQADRWARLFPFARAAKGAIRRHFNLSTSPISPGVSLHDRATDAAALPPQELTSGFPLGRARRR